MRCRLLPATEPDWAATVSRTYHDFYHLPAYAALQAEWLGGEALALHVQDGSNQLLLPLIVQTIPGGGRDATSPYGYSGPVRSPGATSAFVEDALRAGVELLAPEGLVSLCVRMHPLMAVPVPDDVGVLVAQGATVVIDLGADEAEQWRQTRRDHRNQINRSIRLGHRVVFDTGRRHERAFERLYLQTMSRLEARPEYLYDGGYFDGLRSALGARLHLVVVEIGDDIAAGALFVETCGIVQYHLAGSNEHFRRERPTKLLIHEVRGWAKARGDRWLHLGGGLGGADDPLMEFKAGFSHVRLPYTSLRVVLRPADYRALVDARGGSATDDLTGLFPAYRDEGPMPAD
jgi:hypothetical protein